MQLSAILNILHYWIIYFHVICFARIEIIFICTQYHTSVSFSLPTALECRLKVYGNFVRNRRSSLCIVTSLRSGRTWFGSHNCARDLLLSNPSFMVVTTYLKCIAYRWFFLRGTIHRKLNLTSYLRLVSL